MGKHLYVNNQWAKNGRRSGDGKLSDSKRILTQAKPLPSTSSLNSVSTICPWKRTKRVSNTRAIWLVVRAPSFPMLQATWRRTKGNRTKEVQYTSYCLGPVKLHINLTLDRTLFSTSQNTNSTWPDYIGMSLPTAIPLETPLQQPSDLPLACYCIPLFARRNTYGKRRHLVPNEIM